MVPAPQMPSERELPPIVLLVEDDMDTIDMYEIYLTSVGYRVATAHTDESARRAFDELNPDIVIADLGLPGRSAGAGFIQHVSARSADAAVPIIVVTGQDPRSVPHGTAAAVTTILTKPVLPDALEIEVRRVLERSKMLRRQAQTVRQRVLDLVRRSQAVLLKS